jgi:hypothetical protein
LTMYPLASPTKRSRRFYDAALRPLGLVRLLDFEGLGSGSATSARCRVHNHRGGGRRRALAWSSSVLPRAQSGGCTRLPFRSARCGRVGRWSGGIATEISFQLLRRIRARSRRAPHRSRVTRAGCGRRTCMKTGHVNLAACTRCEGQPCLFGNHIRHLKRHDLAKARGRRSCSCLSQAKSVEPTLH